MPRLPARRRLSWTQGGFQQGAAFLFSGASFRGAPRRPIRCLHGTKVALRAHGKAGIDAAILAGDGPIEPASLADI
jgi:hypothetical protein